MDNLEEEEDFDTYQQRIADDEVGVSPNKSPTTKDTFGHSRDDTDDDGLERDD